MISFTDIKELLPNVRMSIDRIVLFTALVSAILFALIVSLTNPEQSGPLMVTGILSLLYVFFGAVVFLTKVFIGRKKLTVSQKKQLLKKSYIMAVPLVFIVGLNTLRQLSIADVAIVTILFFIGSFYISRTFQL